MAGIATVPSMRAAKALLAQHAADTAITSNDGEYRVNKRGGREATAYYTNDLTDAVGTGIAMSRKGAW